jgi:hypothetical protein
MRSFFVILLLLITAAYIFPVKEVSKNAVNIAMSDMAEEQTESNKAEKLKEFIYNYQPGIPLTINPGGKYQHNRIDLPIVFHAEETPPPDVTG